MRENNTQIMAHNTRKRKNIINDNTNNDDYKKRKAVPKTKYLNQDIWKNLQTYQHVSDNITEANNWVSASRTKNYLLRDPIIDWFDLYYAKLGFNDSTMDNSQEKIDEIVKNAETEKKKMEILFDMGNRFENEIFGYLVEKYPGETIMICKNRSEFSDKTKVEETLDAIKKGTPIIMQAMVVNNTNKTYGVADVLIRSDYVNKLFKYKPLSASNEQIKAPETEGNYHYVVIDIKWSNIPLCANKTNILNSDRFLAYKGQLAIYNLALGCMQGYIPEASFILGKSWKCDSKNERGSSCFDLLGVIDYVNFDNQYIDLTAEAVKWMRDVRTNGEKWSCVKPHRYEMYPNMCAQDTCWDKVKAQISNITKELTQVWMVSYKNRNFGHDNNIFKWNDTKCCSENLNIMGKKIGPVIDIILNMNRDDKNIIRPKKIINNTENWKQKHELDFYIDFETFNECLLKTKINIEKSINSNIIFMFGVGYIENNEFKYKSFVLADCTPDNELDTLDRFVDFIEDRTLAYMKANNIEKRENVKPKLFHWANAEKTFLDLANNKFSGKLTSWLRKVALVDMCKIFTTEPIVLKGMFKFKLKEVAAAMHKHGMINTSWKNDNKQAISNGFTAMLDAVNYYRQLSTENNTSGLNSIMSEIIDYNYIDCKVLWEILEYLRKNNV